MKAFTCASLIALSKVASAFPALTPDLLNGKIDLNAKIPLDQLKDVPGYLATRGDLNLLGELPDQLPQLLALIAADATKQVGTEFDAASQLIDVTGDHAFQMPDWDAGDVRGPCPGLNVLANHGYLPRNGVASLLEYGTATSEVLGMGIVISAVLGVYGTALGGNLVALDPSVSMGGYSVNAPQNAIDNLGGLLGAPRGLVNTHNIFEVDTSITRSDLYDADGDNNNMNMDYFMDLYNLQKDAEDPHYSLDVFFEHATNRFNQSIETNPNFFYGPWSGFFVRNAAYCFAARLLGNASVEYPDGKVDKTMLKSMWGVSGPEDNMTYTRGSEQIPANTYRRRSQYSVADLWVDIIDQVVLKHTELFSFGGNVNGVNTFAGVDFADLTGGLWNSAQLLEGNNLECFLWQILREGAPSIISSLYATAEPILVIILQFIDIAATSLSCNNSAFKDLAVNGTNLLTYLGDTYPGANRSGVFI